MIAGSLHRNPEHHGEAFETARAECAHPPRDTATGRAAKISREIVRRLLSLL